MKEVIARRKQAQKSSSTQAASNKTPAEEHDSNSATAANTAAQITAPAQVIATSLKEKEQELLRLKRLIAQKEAHARARAKAKQQAISSKRKPGSDGSVESNLRKKQRKADSVIVQEPVDRSLNCDRTTEVVPETSQDLQIDNSKEKASKKGEGEGEADHGKQIISGSSGRTWPKAGQDMAGAWIDRLMQTEVDTLSNEMVHLLNENIREKEQTLRAKQQALNARQNKIVQLHSRLSDIKSRRHVFLSSKPFNYLFSLTISLELRSHLEVRALVLREQLRIIEAMKDECQGEQREVEAKLATKEKSVESQRLDVQRLQQALEKEKVRLCEAYVEWQVCAHLQQPQAQNIVASSSGLAITLPSSGITFPSSYKTFMI